MFKYSSKFGFIAVNLQHFFSKIGNFYLILPFLAIVSCSSVDDFSVDHYCLQNVAINLGVVVWTGE